MKKVCIVTTRHISYNPRVLKEADALSFAGYDVAVVTINNHSGQWQFDEQLMKTRSWRLRTVNFRKDVGREKLRWMLLAFRQKWFTLLSRFTLAGGIAERSAERAFDGLLGLAKREKADLYIVHHVEALGVGYRAARANHAKWGFDAEDFHSSMNDQTADPLAGYLEKKYLPRCDYFTAASEGIGRAYSKLYGTAPPVTILNSFPLEQLEVRPANDPVRLYWYSQVIGPKRGLEVLLQALTTVDRSFELHLRGSLYSEAYRRTIMDMAGKFSGKGRLFLHDPILAAEIIRDANQFDIGLALELKASENRDLCVTNKLFAYLMAGLAVIATDTSGQKEIAGHFADAVRICRMYDAEDLAAAIIYYIDHPAELTAAKQAARRAAESRFNWEYESQKLLTTIRTCLA